MKVGVGDRVNEIKIYEKPYGFLLHLLVENTIKTV